MIKAALCPQRLSCVSVNPTLQQSHTLSSVYQCFLLCSCLLRWVRGPQSGSHQQQSPLSPVCCFGECQAAPQTLCLSPECTGILSPELMEYPVFLVSSVSPSHHNIWCHSVHLQSLLSPASTQLPVFHLVTRLSSATLWPSFLCLSMTLELFNELWGEGEAVVVVNPKYVCLYHSSQVSTCAN